MKHLYSLALSASLICASTVQSFASTIVATFQGTIIGEPDVGSLGPSYDYGTTFGGGSLLGDPFKFVFTFDPDQGTSFFASSTSSQNYDNPSATATLTINGHEAKLPVTSFVVQNVGYEFGSSVTYQASANTYVTIYNAYPPPIPGDFRVPFAEEVGPGDGGYGHFVSADGLASGYLGPTSVTVAYVTSTVPLPASAPMFGAALLALGGLGYATKRKRAAAA